jgi:tetratricopeptide (TPR) repeat protein
VRSDLSIYLASTKNWDEASDVCLGLIADAPWRLISCAPLVPSKAGAPAPSQKDQDRLIASVERVEKKSSRDPVTLQSLERFYAAVGEKRGAKRVAEQLKTLDEEWISPVSRNPYASPLRGGELDPESIEFIQTLQVLRELNSEDPKARLKHLVELQDAVPSDPRMIAYYQRELAFTLRHSSVDDRAGSRAAIRVAWQATPEDPSVMNELAYMSAVDGVDLEESLNLVDGALERLLGQPFEPLSIPFGESFADFEIARGETAGAYLDTRGWVLFKMGRYEEARRDLELASLMTRDGTVQAHLGRARHALGNAKGAFHHLVRGLALGTEEADEVRALAASLYAELHAIPGGLDVLVQALQEELLREGMEALGGIGP